MLYADITLEQHPPGWEELEWKMRKLKQLNYSYQLQVGRRLFQLKYPEYQFTLIRWEHRKDPGAHDGCGGGRRCPSTPHSPGYWCRQPDWPQVLYEGHDYYAVLGFISMLLKAEEELR
jgi:hypothetical protein